jgi:16S rRNA (guanine527-N7)-methyltransferase
VTSREFHDRLSVRAKAAGVSIPGESGEQLAAYFRLLAQWNAKINLTALPLRDPTDETFDRLLIEPFVAAEFVADSAISWVDIGSGGGSPAIPLKIARPHACLTMVESKGRKAAFLREAVRALALRDVTVKDERFEAAALDIPRQTVDLVTIRGVRSDRALFAAAWSLLAPDGHVLLFHSKPGDVTVPPNFGLIRRVSLRTVSDAQLSVIKAVFHVEQRR